MSIGSSTVQGVTVDRYATSRKKTNTSQAQTRERACCQGCNPMLAAGSGPNDRRASVSCLTGGTSRHDLLGWISQAFNEGGNDREQTPLQ
eukprot:767296-Amphidinium_carterae.1